VKASHPDAPRRAGWRALFATLCVVAATGCSGGGTATSTPAAAESTPAEPLTPAVAARAFQSFTTNDDISRTAGDERLALSWVLDGQSLITAAKFREAAFQETPIKRYTYTKPKFYVPRLENHPQWFLAVAQRTERSADPGEQPEPATAGGDRDAREDDKDTARTALMVFSRKEPGARWRVALASLLDDDQKMPHIAVDGAGYATPLATFDDQLVIQPRFVGAMQATLAEEGPESLAADVMASGEHTSDHYEKTQDKKKSMKEDGFAYDSIFAATQYPVYALRTTDGGGIVLFSMSRDTVVFRKSKKVGRIPIPRPAAHLLEELIMHDELGVVEMHQYAATVPPKAKTEVEPAGKASIVGYDGTPVKATGT
jgi:hypothetical protein